MLLRMLMHSAVFTVAIAVGAVALNGAGLLDRVEPGKGGWSSSGYYGGGYGWKRGGHHDD